MDLATTVSKNLKCELHCETFMSVYTHYISHITKGISAWEFGSRIKKYLPEGTSAKVFRLKLTEDKYNYFTLKLFILKLSELKKGDTDTLVRLADEYGIHDNDLDLIYHIWINSSKFRSRIKRYRKTLPKDLLTQQELEDNFAIDIYPKVKKYIKHWTYKKLRFLVNSQNTTFEDYHSDLAIKAIQTYYNLMPCDMSIEHIINYIKRAVHNDIMNIIKYNTTQKRGRLVCVGTDGSNIRQFSLLSVSENQMNLASMENPDKFSIEDQNYCSIDPTERLENEVFVSTVLSTIDKRSKKYRILMILMGDVDEDFTTWLISRNYCKKDEDNTMLQERISITKYKKLISQFLHVDDDKLNVFLSELGSKISTNKVEKNVGTSSKQTTSKVSCKKNSIQIFARR